MVKIVKIAPAVTLLLFYAVVPDFAAAQAQLFKSYQQTELRVAFSMEMGGPDRYKLDISRSNISFCQMASQGGQPFYLAGIDQGRDSSEAGSANSTYTYKDPTAAFFIGFIPGFFIHGLGHAYIGKGSAAWLLFGIELASLGLFTAGAITSIKGEDDPEAPDPEPWWLSGYALFLSSWMYDFSAAPAKAIRMNQQAELERRSKAAISIDAGIKNNQARLVIALRW